MSKEYTIAELAELVGKSENTITNWKNKGFFSTSAEGLNGKMFFDRTAIEAIVENRLVSGEALTRLQEAISDVDRKRERAYAALLLSFVPWCDQGQPEAYQVKTARDGLLFRCCSGPLQD